MVAPWFDIWACVCGVYFMYICLAAVWGICVRIAIRLRVVKFMKIKMNTIIMHLLRMFSHILIEFVCVYKWYAVNEPNEHRAQRFLYYKTVPVHLLFFLLALCNGIKLAIYELSGALHCRIIFALLPLCIWDVYRVIKFVHKKSLTSGTQWRSSCYSCVVLAAFAQARHQMHMFIIMQDLRRQYLSSTWQKYFILILSFIFSSLFFF